MLHNFFYPEPVAGTEAGAGQDWTGAGATLFGWSRSREKRGGSGSSSTAQAPATYDPMFKEKI